MFDEHHFGFLLAQSKQTYHRRRRVMRLGFYFVFWKGEQLVDQLVANFIVDEALGVYHSCTIKNLINTKCEW